VAAFEWWRPCHGSPAPVLPPGRDECADPDEFRCYGLYRWHPVSSERLEGAQGSPSVTQRQVLLTSLDRRGKPTAWEAPVAISGRVLSHDGVPLPNMRVVISQTGLPQDKKRITRAVITGLDGSYRILILPPGRYSVSIYNNDFPQQKPVEQFSIEIQEMPVQKDFRLSGPLPVAAE